MDIDPGEKPLVLAGGTGRGSANTYRKVVEILLSSLSSFESLFHSLVLQFLGNHAVAVAVAARPETVGALST